MRHGLRRVARWVQTYFGFGTTVILLVRGDEVRIEAAHNAPPGVFEGLQAPRGDVYCSDVIAAGSTLLLNDPEHHPCEHFSRHNQVSQGWRFYAGVPLKTSDGAAIGTLSILDTHRREFRTEDMHVLEALGLATARAFETGRWPIDEDRLFERERLELFCEVVVARATRAGSAGVVMTMTNGAPLAEVPGLAAVRLDPNAHRGVLGRCDRHVVRARVNARSCSREGHDRGIG